VVQEALEDVEFMQVLDETTRAAIEGGEAAYEQSIRDRHEARIAAERITTEAILELNEQYYQYVEEMEQKAAENRQANVERFIATTESVAGTISTIVETVGKVAAAAIKDEKKRMQATAAITAILESIAAAVEIAKAIGAYPDVIGIAAHAASAAAHITAAVLAAKYGGGGVTTPSKSAGGGAAGAFKPQGEGEGTRSTTIIIQGHIFSPEGGAGFVRQAMEASENQRDPGRTRKEMT
jgi:hypothetical protein